MTQPAHVQLGVGDPAEIIAGVERLNTGWGLRYAVITTVTGDNSAVGVYHGDLLSEIPFISLIGSLFVGQRVAALFIPPSGNYVISDLDGSGSQLIDAVDISVDGPLYTTSGTTELDIDRLARYNLTLRAGQLYSTEIQLITVRSVADAEYLFRVRRDSALTGTQLAAVTSYGVSNTAGQLVHARMLWTVDADVTTHLFLSVARVFGSGIMEVFGSVSGGTARSHLVLTKLGATDLYRTIIS